MVGGGGLAALLALLLLSFAVAYWIADAIDNLGTGFLIVGLVYAAVAAVLVLWGKTADHVRRRRSPSRPSRRIKADVESAEDSRGPEAGPRDAAPVRLSHESERSSDRG